MKTANTLPKTLFVGNTTEAHITVAKLDKPESWGDWHDRPLRYIVQGPGSEDQKFTTKKAALRYASIRRRSVDQLEAIQAFAK